MPTYRLTRESARAADACYDDERLAELIPPAGLSPREVAALAIPAEDRHWALVYACGANDRILREHACWCARTALEAERAAGREPDPRSWRAVEVAERYARGDATEGELAAAHAAARAAAARAATWASARAAAARAATWASARDADATWAATWAAARDAARDAQIADIVSRLEAAT